MTPREKWSTRAQMCTGKVRHASKGQADAHARQLDRRYGDQVQSYTCFWCGQWHVGHDREAA